MNISFIIPIYNTPERKLINCLNSFNNLQNLEYEVVLIDDGSDSYIKSICDQYTKNSDVFCYYRKVNGGVSEARNLGIRKAKGDYVAFVDADDCIIPNAYIIDLFNNDSEIILFDLIVKNVKEERICVFGNQRESGWYTLEELFIAFFNDSRLGGPYAKLYRRKFLIDNNIQFNTGMIVAEDADFLCRIIDKLYVMGEKPYYINIPAYIYNYSSLTNNLRIKNNPSIVLKNYLHISRKKMELIERLSFDSVAKQTYLNKARNSIVKTLYSFTASVLSYGILNNELEADIMKSAKMLRDNYYIDKTSNTIISKFYLWCIIHKHWYAIKAYSIAKTMYMRLLLR